MQTLLLSLTFSSYLLPPLAMYPHIYPPIPPSHCFLTIQNRMCYGGICKLHRHHTVFLHTHTSPSLYTDTSPDALCLTLNTAPSPAILYIAPPWVFLIIIRDILVLKGNVFADSHTSGLLEV